MGPAIYFARRDLIHMLTSSKFLLFLSMKYTRNCGLDNALKSTAGPLVGDMPGGAAIVVIMTAKAKLLLLSKSTLLYLFLSEWK